MNIEQYMPLLIAALREQFVDRLVYVGLQGSYLRGEATADSDIDVMVVLDSLSVCDLAAYRRVIESLPESEKSCGFICGRDELANWNPLEIFTLLHGTKDYVGALRELVPVYTTDDVRNFVKLSANNLYHELCHRAVHGTEPLNLAALAQSYKSAFFILQSMQYLKSGQYVATKAALMQVLKEDDLAVLQRADALKKGSLCDVDDSFSLLFTWCQRIVQSI